MARFNPNPDPLLIKPDKPITAVTMLIRTRPWLRARARPSFRVLQRPESAMINRMEQIQRWTGDFFAFWSDCGYFCCFVVSGSGSRGGSGVGARRCRSGRKVIVVIAQSRMNGRCRPYWRVDVEVDTRDIESGVLDRRAFEGGEVHCSRTYMYVLKSTLYTQKEFQGRRKPNDETAL